MFFKISENQLYFFKTVIIYAVYRIKQLIGRLNFNNKLSVDILDF